MIALLLAPAILLAVPQEPPRRDFGFADFEIYEFRNGIFGLAAGDLDGDGTADLALANNARSRIELLVRLDPDEADAPDPDLDPDEPNPVTFDGRFRRVPHAVELRIQRLDLGDFDGDGRAELAYAVDGGKVNVVFGAAGGTGAERRIVEREVDELRGGCQLLRAVDVNGDGNDDLLLAGEDALVALESDGNGGFAPVRTIEHLDEPVDEIHVTDLDGDGRRDLLGVHLGRDYPFRYRLAQADGTLGPRVEIEQPIIRSAAVRDLDGDGREELLAIFRLSGRLACFQAAAPAEPRPAVVRYLLRKPDKGRSNRTYGVGDLDSDGAADVVVANPDDAALTVFLGRSGVRALERVDAPSLVGVTDPRIGDVDGDGRREVVVVSGPERMLGIGRPGDAFPRTVPIDGEPAAMDLADVDGDGFDDAVVIATTGEGRNKEYRLQILRGGPEGPSSVPWITQVLEGVRKAPNAVRAFDLDGDGRGDVMAFLPGENEVPVILIQTDDGFVADPRGADVPGLGILKGTTPASMDYVDCDGDGRAELFVAARNFARTIHFSLEEGALRATVHMQVNAPAADSQITGCTAGDLSADGRAEILLFDDRTNEILVFGRGAGDEIALRERLEAGRSDNRGMVPADLDADGRDDVVLLGEDGFGVLYARSADPVLTESASYEPRKVGSYLDRIAVGDLNHDGRDDVVLTEASEHGILIVTPQFPRFERVLGFKVFEAKTFTSGAEGREPREIVSAELTGDGKDDLAVLVHDKLILYIQE